MKDSEATKRKPRLLPGLGGKPLTAPDDTSLLLKRLQEIAIELRSLKKLHPHWKWEGLGDDKPEHVCRIGKLMHDRIAIIGQLRQLGVSNEDAEEHERKALQPTNRDGTTPQGREAPRHAKRRKRRGLNLREKAIIGVLELNLKGMDYCLALEARKIPPPQDWLDEGCPATYPLAYKKEKFRKRIPDEKYRLSKYLPRKNLSAVLLVRDEKIFASRNPHKHRLFVVITRRRTSAGG